MPRELMYMSTYSFTSELVGDEWSVSRSGRCIPGTHWIGGWVVNSNVLVPNLSAKRPSYHSFIEI
jgi:hypothetical protein